MCIKGWLGRADQTTKVKGMFVHAEQIEKIRQDYQNIAKMRLTVTSKNHNDQMHLQCELNTKGYSETDIAGTMKNISASMKKTTKLSGTVELVAIGNLSDDGKVIDDLRVIG